MDAVPGNIDYGEVRDFLASRNGVRAVHHVHIWSLGAGEVALTAHLLRPEDADHGAFLAGLNHELEHRFGINHATVQIEHEDGCQHVDHGRPAHQGAPSRASTPGAGCCRALPL